MRPTASKAKDHDRDKLAADIAAFKAKGGKVEKLPGFGAKQTDITFSAIRLNHKKGVK